MKIAALLAITFEFWLNQTEDTWPSDTPGEKVWNQMHLHTLPPGKCLMTILENQ